MILYTYILKFSVVMRTPLNTQPSVDIEVIIWLDKRILRRSKKLLHKSPSCCEVHKQGRDCLSYTTDGASLDGSAHSTHYPRPLYTRSSSPQSHELPETSRKGRGSDNIMLKMAYKSASKEFLTKITSKDNNQKSVTTCNNEMHKTRKFTLLNKTIRAVLWISNM